MSGTRPARSDLAAALTGLALLAPETVAFAQIAGVPPAAGLAAAPLCLAAYTLIGRGTPSVLVGATAATAVVTSAAVAGLSADPSHRAALAAALAIGTGVLLLLTGLLRFGFVVRFLTPEALQGFLFGLAVVIVVRQVAVILDVETRQGNVFVRSWDVAGSVRTWSLTSAAVGLACVLLLVVLEGLLPRFPGALVALAASAAAAWGLHLFDHGVAHVMQVPSGWPHPALPLPAASDLPALAGSATGLAVLTFVLGHGLGQRLSAASDGPLDPDREMVGLGVANILAGLVGGAAVTASPSASSAAQHAGARTWWTPALTSGLLVVVALALTPAFRWLPEPALAAVVIMAVRPFLAVAPLWAYARSDSRSLAVALTAIAGVVTLTLIPGLLLAVTLSLLIFIGDASHLRVSRLGRSEDGAYLDVERFPQAVRPDATEILRPDGQLFFANLDPLIAAVDSILTAEPGARAAPTVVLVDLAASFGLTLPAVQGLQLVRRHVESADRTLWFVHAYLGTRDVLAGSPLRDVPVFATIDDAVAAASDLDTSATLTSALPLTLGGDTYAT